MTVEDLLAQCELVRASEKKLAECKPFSCGEGDLDEFFAKDCLVNQRKLLGKTYLFCLKSQPDTIVTAFSLSNDSIRLTNRITDEYKEQFLEDTELRDKTLKRFPAVLIGSSRHQQRLRWARLRHGHHGLYQSAFPHQQPHRLSLSQCRCPQPSRNASLL